MSVARRTTLTIMAMLIMLGAVAGVASVSTRATVDVRSAGTVTSVPAAPVSAVPEEDQPAFNPCTMGNTHPCGLGTVLPGGAWFEVNVSAVHPDGVTCDQGQEPVHVAVLARTDVTDRVLAQESVTLCAEGTGPRMAPQVAEILPGMYRIVAAQV